MPVPARVRMGPPRCARGGRRGEPACGAGGDRCAPRPRPRSRARRADRPARAPARRGLAAPALVIEHRGPLSALGRSFALVGRGGLRPGAIRLLGYLAWWTIRLALAAGGYAALQLTGQLSGGVALRLAGVLAWVLVNTVAYAVLGCLDAVLHLETRMRVEGLDLALGRAARRGIPAEQILVGRR